ncbi:hypothetical protein A2366_02465 [Candidatus Woesebacteria bacterium RIFOXYB1_FULL_33_9]|uniref:Holin n=1 Tax=Candidatus Woesebacteria bacterium GW2011_GWB1_33_22 TaxID=1618566 RepID=A0A0G0A1D9_9BACT|nr:MAG: hypothetical protein UR35_C0004G0003 [Candidatus Woesebacteria bacterium GW2011_GWB1_33_22]KKP50692.1 MAG: hypothetical protein UR41_C0004G0003 [Candidatus Woesebacteria bacterium GW2011_GWA1_33_33]OGM81102.1 MAG: hypothetical protein A2366_02465 [Candidatus Woesebacteria bacterium RIFOXYB1_FULL_33_9]OGM86828.1 MAG: hypothetical protein A2616_02750 [Candidatus Woesebacteria bacterium RIFOXYD1_FULL_33_11]
MGEINYPYYKTLIWRFVRAGIAGGVSTVIAVQVVLQPDLSNYKEYALAVAAGFTAGFISAIAKTVRDYLSEGDKAHWTQKLPL